MHVNRVIIELLRVRFRARACCGCPGTAMHWALKTISLWEDAFCQKLSPFFSGMPWGTPVRWCSSLIKYKGIIFKARGNIPVGDTPSFPRWKEPVPGCLSQHDSSHTLLLPACSQTTTGSPTRQQAVVKYRFSSWNYVVFSILAIRLW